MNQHDNDKRPFFEKRIIRELVSYGVIGCFASGVDALLFAAFVYAAGMNDLVSNFISVIVGITISFFFNRTLTFKTKDNVIRRYVRFFCVGMSGLFLSECLLYLGGIIGFEPMVTKIISIFIVALFQFVLNKMFSFKPMKQDDTKEP